MKKNTIIILLLSVIFVFYFPPPAEADTRVYISISIGGGALIGMVGYYFHVTYSSRMAQNKEGDPQRTEFNNKLALKPSSPSVPQHSPLYSKDPQHPDFPPQNRLEVNLFTYNW